MTGLLSLVDIKVKFYCIFIRLKGNKNIKKYNNYGFQNRFIICMIVLC